MPRSSVSKRILTETPDEIREYVKQHANKLVMTKEEIHSASMDLWPMQTDFDHNMREAFKRGVLSDTARKHWEPKWIDPKDALPEIDESTKNDFGYYSKLVICICDKCPNLVVLKAHYLPDKTFFGWCGGNCVVQKWMPKPTFND